MPKIFYTIDLIEPIARLFHLQMNISKLFTFIFLGMSNDEYSSFLHFSIVLRRRIYKNINDFYLNNDFFQTIIHSYIIILCIYKSNYTKFDLIQY